MASSSSDPRTRAMGGFSRKELDVITACVKECGLNYVDVLNAAYTETGKMAILSDANASFLGKVVQTTQTRNFIKRWREPVKSVVHVEQGLGHQKLKDDKLFHQTRVEHTASFTYECNRTKKNKADGKPAYHSADICAVQLGFSSHLSAYTNQVAGVMLLDGARATTEQAVLAVGVIPLYKPISHALFFPRLCIDYGDDDFLDRLQLVTTFSDDVRGNGHTALSYSSLSVVRHNKIDPCWLPEALPWSTVEKKFPHGVQALQNFQITEISSLTPASLTKTAAYVPLRQKTPATVLDWKSGDATVRNKSSIMSRNHISFSGMTMLDDPRRSVSLDSTLRDKLLDPVGICKVHNRSTCPCEQHTDTGLLFGAGPIEDTSYGPGEKTAVVASTAVEISLQRGFHDIGTTAFTIAVGANIGTIALSLPICHNMIKNTTFGRSLGGLSWMKISLKCRLSGSASMQTKGLFWLCYDPNNTLDRYSSRDRALMLRGVWFMPGRYDSVDLDLPDIACPAGIVDMQGSMSGSIKVVLIDSLINVDTAHYAMDLQILMEVSNTIPTSVPPLGPSLCENFLPLGQIAVASFVNSATPKGKTFVIPIFPVYPGTDGAQLYPSVSSSVLEAHNYWTGEVEIEIVFSMPALSGGTVIIGITQDTANNTTIDDFTRFGKTIVDLRSQRIVRIRVNMQSWTSLNTAGKGSLFGCNPGDQVARSPRLFMIFPGPPIISDTQRHCHFFVRYIGIHNPKLYTPVIAPRRTTPMNFINAAGPANLSLIGGDAMEWKWQDPYCVRVRDLFEKPRSFRLVSYTSWPNDGWLHIPCTPCCFVPSFADGFLGEMEPLNYLSHRAQENAMWRGTLRYYVKVNREASDGPFKTISMVAYPNEGLAVVPSYTRRNTFVVAPVMSKNGCFLATEAQLVAEITTPGDRWFWTRYGNNDQYTSEFHPRWLSLQFPHQQNNVLGVSSIDLFVEADVEFQFPIPPFPLCITTDLPSYFWEDTVVVD